ncbi:hypothetical protein ABI59_00245 [Acidobacteria bacterium Mor1]|nr:hypothetical protein ABI59_00245 [Acidobacteria bacterium Mor1]
MNARERIVSLLLVLVGIVNLLPVAGIRSGTLLAKAYGISEPEGDLLILMRHRALLFGVLGGLILVSAFRRHLQPAAIAAGFVSMVGFVAIAVMAGNHGPEIHKVVLVDIAASVALSIVVVLRGSSAKETP